MNALGVAVVGTGFIGPVHVEALRRVPGVCVTGILGSSAERSRQAAERLGLPRAYASYGELLADPDVRSVHLATPNRLHFEQVRAALDAGKHVLCEKPLAMDSRQTAALAEQAARAGLAAGVNYNLRFYPLCQEAADRVRRGALGQIHHVSGGYAQDWLLEAGDFNWRVLAEEGGPLRAVADIGTHWLDLVQFILGQRVTAVCADLRTVHPVRRRPRGSSETFAGGRAAAADDVSIDTEDFGSLLLEFSGGTRGLAQFSQVVAGRKNCLRFEIAAARQALAWNSERPEELWIGRRGQPNELLLRDPALLGAAARAATAYPGGHAEGFPDSFKHCFRAFYGSILNGDFQAPPPFPTFADGHREALLCDSILASHRRRGWEPVAAAAES